MLISPPLRQLCEHRIQRLVTPGQLKTHGLTSRILTRRISQIVAANLQSGRVQRILLTSSNPDHQRLGPYIDRVITTFLSEHGRVERLVNCDTDEWARLVEQLASRATVMLSHLRQSSTTAIEALDFAHEACEAIFRHPFPFDVDFNAWAALILKNCILQRYTRSRDILDRAVEIVSIDQSGPDNTSDDYSLHDLLADPSPSVFEQQAVQEWLMQAIDRLPSAAQQHVIIDAYFYDRTEDEIARRLGKTRQAVYNLKHRALRRLRQLLIDERHDAEAALKEIETTFREGSHERQ